MSSLRRSKHFSTALLLLFVFLGLMVSPCMHAYGSNTPKKKTPAAPEDDRILITAVNVSAQQLTITYQKNKSQHVYTVDGITQITAQGRAGTLKDIKVGQQVYNYVERDDHTLDTLEVAAAQPAPVAPAAPAKAAQKPKTS